MVGAIGFFAGAVRRASPVKISGTYGLGQVLTAITTLDDPVYQWTRDGVAISGATSATYTMVSADVGAEIGVVVTGALASNPLAPPTGVPVGALLLNGRPITLNARYITLNEAL